MEEMTQVTICLVNYDEVVEASQAIIDACQSLSIPSVLMGEWLNEYIAANMIIEVK